MSYTEALKEAYASAPVDKPALVTLEIHHPSFEDDQGNRTAIRVVRAYKDYTLGLEPTAPLNGGQMVLFQKCAFELKEPGFSEKNVPTMPITINGVSRKINGYLEQAILTRAPLVVYMRPYLESNLTAPSMDPPYRFELTNVTVDLFQVTGECNLKDVFNFGFPNDKFTTTVFPGLVT